MIEEAINIIRRWAANEKITDRTAADNMELIEIRRAALEWADGAHTMPPPACSDVNLETVHDQLIREEGVFVDLFRRPGEWAYVLRNSASGKPLLDDVGLPTTARGFGSYREALRHGIAAAMKYDQRLIH